MSEPREQTLRANLEYLMHHCETAVRRFQLLHQGGVKMTLGADPNISASELSQAMKTVLHSLDKMPQPEPPVPAAEVAVLRQEIERLRPKVTTGSQAGEVVSIDTINPQWISTLRQHGYRVLPPGRPITTGDEPGKE